ncbi:MAG: hypothetical protein JSU61_11315, partial [Fidelibacterota bacterium]
MKHIQPSHKPSLRSGGSNAPFLLALLGTILFVAPSSIYAPAPWPDQFRSLSKGTEPPADFNH